jgi:hypothetical protein
LISEDLPTFDRPTNATSTVASGKVLSRDADSTNEICRGLPELTAQTSQVIERKVQEAHATLLLNADNHTCRRTDRTRKDTHEMRLSISPISPVNMPTACRRALGAIAAAGLVLATSGCGAIAE